MNLPPVDYLLLGHVTHDLLPNGGYTIGGTVAYAARTAAALRRRVGIVTSVGPDFDTTPFTGIGTLVQMPAAATTTFKNLYINAHREQYVYAQAQALTPAQIPPEWEHVAIAHIGPVLGECDAALVEHFAGRTFVGVTPQGWMRAVDAQQRVVRIPWREAERILSQASATVCSIEDLGGDWDLARAYAQLAAILVVTTGREGGVIFQNGDAQAFPTLGVTEVDPTGAGDIFAASFFVALAHGADAPTAARYAARLAAISVTRVGLNSTPRLAEVAPL